jgi:hypothetical protein
MGKRKLLGVVVVIALSAAVFAMWPVPIPPPHFTRDDYAKIKEGMTEAEVLAILGEPGYYCTGPVDSYLIDGEEGDGGLSIRDERLTWCTDSAGISVTLRENNLIDKVYYRCIKRKLSLYDSIRHRVIAAWYRLFPSEGERFGRRRGSD